jgi:hypothetical protein
MEGVKVKNAKLSPRWGKFTVKSETQVDFAIRTLIEAQARLKEAMKAGEPTGAFSGGEGSLKKVAEEPELEEELDEV